MSVTTGGTPFSVTLTSSAVASPPFRESLASAGFLQADYERVLPWVTIRWNPDLSRHERWHNYYGYWGAADWCDVQAADAVVRFGDTWAEPIDVSPEAPHGGTR